MGHTASRDPQIDAAITSINAAESAADELQGQMAAAGVQDKVAELAAVKDAIESTRTHLLGGADLAHQAVDLTKAAGG
jgi:hypothetical protein